jgi:hypothetical protein
MRRSRALCLQSLRYPDFDDGLASHPKPIRFLVQGVNHPSGKVHVDALGLLIGPPGAGEFKKPEDVFPDVEPFVEFLSFHKVPSLLAVIA